MAITHTADKFAETPIRRAQRLFLAPQRGQLSACQLAHLRRICTKLHEPIVKILDDEVAPLGICRRIAWGKWHQQRAVRLALAMLLRKEADPNNPRRALADWAWPRERLMSAAEKLFYETPQYKRLVQFGVLSDKKVPDLNNTVAFTHNWSVTWARIQAEMATIDRATFTQKMHTLAKSRKRRTVRKRVVLSERERGYLEAIDTLRRGVLRGDIKLGDSDLVLPKKKGAPR